MFPGAAEAAFAPVAGFEIRHHPEIGLHHRHDDHLGDAFEGLDGEGYLATSTTPRSANRAERGTPIP